MEITNAIIDTVKPIEHCEYKGEKLHLLMRVQGKGVNSLMPFIIYKNSNYAFDLIKNFKSNKFAEGDTVDFQYNEATPPRIPVIWRMYNHKRTRDES